MTLLKEILQINESPKSSISKQIHKFVADRLPEWKANGEGSNYIASFFQDDEKDEWADNIDDLMSHFEHNYVDAMSDDDKESAIQEIEGFVANLVDS